MMAASLSSANSGCSDLVASVGGSVMIGLAIYLSVVQAPASYQTPGSHQTDVIAQPSPATSSLATLKGLVGVWKVADKPNSRLRIRFYMTAGDTVLVESWERDGQPYSLTLYHHNGSTLMTTHYCPQGNQPRLTLTRSSTATMLRFAFQDATDLDPEHEAYLRELTFDLSSPDVLLRRESYRSPEGDNPSELRLVHAVRE